MAGDSSLSKVLSAAGRLSHSIGLNCKRAKTVTVFPVLVVTPQTGSVNGCLLLNVKHDLV